MQGYTRIAMTTAAVSVALAAAYAGAQERAQAGAYRLVSFAGRALPTVVEEYTGEPDPEQWPLAALRQRLLEWLLESARCAGMASIHLELRANNDAARRFYRAMSFYETVLVPGYYRSGEGRKEGALRMLRVLRAPGPVPYTWRPPRTEDT